MPESYLPSQSSSRKNELITILNVALPFLRSELQIVDPALPSFVSLLCSVSAGECWHKDGCFLGHLIDVYRILKLWGSADPVARCGLFHSVYSNSYVDLAIFDPVAGGRELLRSIIGPPAERLVYLFCVVPRHSLIHDHLLFRYADDELLDHLSHSALSINLAKENSIFAPTEPWRVKLKSVLPANGITVKHIKSGDDVHLSRRMVATFLLMTMADFSDQHYGFQDELFDNDNGRMEFVGNTYTALWPGDGKPGLWMNSVSRMAAIYSLIVREEEIFIEERKSMSISQFSLDTDRDEDMELAIPPVFEGCTKVLDVEAQKAARDLYWEVVSQAREKGEVGGLKSVEGLLLECCKKNPYVGEPHLVLGQVYIGEGRFEEAEREAEVGVRLLLEWGSPWDKRMSWEGWVAWGRLLLGKAKEKSWPRTSFGIINLGLVR